MKRLLLVEDEPELALALSDRLRAEGYDLTVVTHGHEALDRARQQVFDLILLDLMLPGKDGLAVCRELRQEGFDTPILIVTALGDVVDKVVGLRLGADDYLTKPFETIELLARIEALLRRTGAAPHPAVALPDPYCFGDVEVYFRRVEALRGGRPVRLSARMFELLRFFIEHRGETLSRDELLDGAWDREAMPGHRTVDVHVAWLRKGLEPNPKRPQYFLTVRGFGYKFVG